MTRISLLIATLSLSVYANAAHIPYDTDWERYDSRLHSITSVHELSSNGAFLPYTDLLRQRNFSQLRDLIRDHSSQIPRLTEWLALFRQRDWSYPIDRHGNSDTAAVPLPGAALLFLTGLGLFGIGVKRRRH